MDLVRNLCKVVVSAGIARTAGLTLGWHPKSKPLSRIIIKSYLKPPVIARFLIDFDFLK